MAEDKFIIAGERFLPIDEVVRTVGASRSTIYAWIAAGLFPPPRQLGPKRVGWLNSEVQAWIATRVPTR